MLIGLTGGVATGKSTVSGALKKRNIQVIDADRISHQVTEPGKPAYSLIVRFFSKDVPDLLNADSTINRQALGKLIFVNSAKRRLLNSFVHPFVIYEMLRAYLSAVYSEPFSFVVWDVPLLFETFLHWIVNFSVVVSCSEAAQIERLKRRSPHLSLTEVRERILSQMPLSEKKEKASFVIENDTSLVLLETKVAEMLRTARSKQSIWWEAVHYLLAGAFFLAYCVYLRILTAVQKRRHPK